MRTEDMEPREFAESFVDREVEYDVGGSNKERGRIVGYGRLGVLIAIPHRPWSMSRAKAEECLKPAWLSKIQHETEEYSSLYVWGLTVVTPRAKHNDWRHKCPRCGGAAVDLTVVAPRWECVNGCWK